MAPALAQGVIRRDNGTGKTFSIVFAVIAFLVVAICILWGYFIPKWRFKYGRPSSTRFNCIGGASKYGPGTPPRAPTYVPRFPSHPGVRGLHKEPSLPIYNPRTETPFGNSPRSGEFLNLRSLIPTPATERKISVTRTRPTHDYELPKTPGTLSQLALSASLRDLSFEEDEESESRRHIMPLVARPAGRPPPLTRQLALFPTPASTSTKRFDTLAHPNLLFERLDKLDLQNILPFSDESCVSGSTLVPKRKIYGDRTRNNIIQNVDDVESEAAKISKAGDGSKISGGPSRTSNTIELPIAVTKRIHKYKPKTPVANIRHGHDRYARGAKFIPPRKASLQRGLTPSTEPLTASASAKSDFAAMTTPPTSPPLPGNDPTLIPTPLCVRRATARAACGSPTPAQASVRRTSSSENSIALSPGKLAPFSLQKNLKSKRDFRKSIGFCHPKSTLGTTVAKPKPLHVKRVSWKSSSVYSRDTMGMSILRSPTFAPSTDDRSARSLPVDELSPRRANSMDLVRSKIDDWNLHTGDLHLPIPPSSDRPQSDVGPRSPPLRDNAAPVSALTPEDGPTTFGLTIPIPKIYVGRPSDDVFGDGGSAKNCGRVLRRVLDMEMASTESNSSRYYGRTAPGGAEWI